MDFLQLLETGLSAKQAGLLKTAGQTAHKKGTPLYLVGGAVRDLLLGRPVEDIDLVVQGDAVSLADDIARGLSGRVVARSQFSTAKVRVAGTSIDFTTARREQYSRPGSLPQIVPGTVEEDMARRDFSINAMAFPIHPGASGQLLDPFGGREDLGRGLIRVLHDKSFTDDATRILRAVRYQHRLDFRLEEHTKALLHRDLPMLDTISGDRLRKELLLCFREERPIQLLMGAMELGVLEAIYPPLARSMEALQIAGHRKDDGSQNEQMCLGLLACALTSEEGEGLTSRLRMPAGWAAVVKDTIGLRDRLGWLSGADLSPPDLYETLAPYTLAAVEACALATPREKAQQSLSLFLDKLRHVRPSLGGKDLIALGVPQGHAIGEMLEKLRLARLEGDVTTRSEEAEMVKKLLATQGH